MPMFRKKPEVFEANQFKDAATAPVGVRTEEDGRAYVTTAHNQKVYLESGDWIVAEKNGNGYYPIKPEIFVTICDQVGGFELHETNHEPSRWQVRHEVRGWHHKTFATKVEAIAWCERTRHNHGVEVMETIKQMWDDYALKVLAPENVSREQYVETRRAFYAGVFSMLSAQGRAVDSDISDDEGSHYLEGLMDEVAAFYEDVKAGKA